MEALKDAYIKKFAELAELTELAEKLNEENRIHLFSSSLFTRDYTKNPILPDYLKKRSVTNPIRHTNLKYEPYHKYLDMVCCLFNLDYLIYPPTGQQQGGGSLIKKIPSINEIIIQRLLSIYLGKDERIKYLVEFKDFFYHNNNLHILQKKVGFGGSTNLEEYINSQLIFREDRDTLYMEILEKLGINLDKAELQHYKASFKAFKEKTDSSFLENYLEKFIEGSFFAVMRDLYEYMGFLHLDFKLRNIFINKVEGCDDWIPIIADLDKSRLSCPSNFFRMED